jgi:hypothetical protein
MEQQYIPGFAEFFLCSCLLLPCAIPTNEYAQKIANRITVNFFIVSFFTCLVIAYEGIAACNISAQRE